MTTMTRAHFKMIASALKFGYELCDAQNRNSAPLTEEQKRVIALAVASVLSSTNDRFNFEKFYEATLDVKSTN